MLNRRPSPYLVFDFPNETAHEPSVFSHPVRIITAHNLDEVTVALGEVERATQLGCFAAGFLSYEAAPSFDDSFSVHAKHVLPLLWFGVFERPSTRTGSPPEGFGFAPWEPSMDRNEYRRRVTKIKEAIARGDTYQVNLTMRLLSHFSGDDLGAYDRLMRAQKARYCAYLDIGRFHILSFSPELFFSLKGKEIVTKPMKGTARRGRWAEEDTALASWLRSSEKNRAENVMIVDLLRNDLSRIAETGSVQVARLFDVEPYPTVHQMTSTITAKVRSGAGLVDIFKALFPCGSVTGAPKSRTTAWISALETDPREVYCGAVGFVRPYGDAIFNVAIRTMFIDSQTGQAQYGAGGGITWDSVDDAEYDELSAKVDFLRMECPPFLLLETLKLESRKYALLDRHLARLAKSANYFGIRYNLDEIRRVLVEHAGLYPFEARRVRLLVSQEGHISVESAAFTPSLEGSRPVCLAKSPISKDNPFLYHKTTHRPMYDVHRAQNERVFDVLLWNEAGEVTEFTTGNIVLEIGDQKITPAVPCGLLPGTFRAQLLEDGSIKEKIVSREDLNLARRIWFVNSVRGWVPVHLV